MRACCVAHYEANDRNKGGHLLTPDAVRGEGGRVRTSDCIQGNRSLSGTMDR